MTAHCILVGEVTRHDIEDLVTALAQDLALLAVASRLLRVAVRLLAQPIDEDTDARKVLVV